MTFMRWDPLRDLMEFQERMNRLFDETFARTRREEVPSRSAWTPPVDIYGMGDEIVIDVELPEVNMDEVSVDVEGNVLTIKGEKPPSREANPDQYHLFERCYGPFSRSFSLPHSLDPEEIKGSYKNGILTLRVPKRAKPKRIAIEE